MYHKFRITVASLTVMTLCMLSSTATISYFTDTDTKSNEFTVGNAETSLSIFDDVSNEDREQWRAFDVANYAPLTDGIEIPFYLLAKNTGNIPVYQRFRVVLPTALSNLVTIDFPNLDNCAPETAPDNTCESSDFSITYNPAVEVEGEPTYAEYYITSLTPLALNSETSVSPTEKIRINGLSETNKSLFTCENNDQNSCAFGINVYSDAIQTTGFGNALEAFSNFAETYN